MSLYVQKWLAHGPIRFGVIPRHEIGAIDADPSLSTGTTGEFLRRRTHGFFFADTRKADSPHNSTPGIASTPFWSSLKPEDSRGWALIGLMGLGALLILLGFAVIAGKGAQGWVEVIIGLAMIASPIVVMAQRRRQIRLREEAERSEREERESKNREILASYSSALDRLRATPNEETLTASARERENLEMPYRIWSPLARRTVLYIGFEALHQLTPKGAAQVSRAMDEAAEATGLLASDARDVKIDLYRVALWHLLADDRLGEVQSEQLRLMRDAFGITDADLETDTMAVDEFNRLRGVTRDNLPRQQCQLQLLFREFCIHTVRGNLIPQRGAPQPCTLFLTNKRIVIDARKRIQIQLINLDDIVMDVDSNVMTLRLARPAAPVAIQVDQPIYSAALMDIATTMDDRPRGFA